MTTATGTAESGAATTRVGTAAVPMSDASITAFSRPQRLAILWNIILSFIGLLLGGLPGILQALERIDVNLYGNLGGILNENAGYYQGLTLHGVLLVIVFTFTFSNGFLSLAVMRAYGRSMASTALMQLAFWMALVGTALAGWAMLANEATVLFTFYPPLKAHWAFYVGAVLLVVSTWVTLLNMYLTHRQWRAENPDERMPLMAFTSIMTYTMWFIASLGIAAEVLLLILPWVWGWTDAIDPQLSRTLFWFSGHPIVYFWLLPAYVSWYTMLPKQARGRLMSDPLVRLVFIMFLLLSTPVGFHHQFTESGIPAWMKSVHGVFTFAVFFPSMITAFSVISALEYGARQNGGKGLFAWIFKLPWGNPSVAAQLMAGLIFFLGGASGLINASQTVNLVVHNTAFVVGHFHMTVGSAVALSFIGIAYWLLPYLTGRKLYAPRLAVWQAWLWTIGVLIFARGQISSGLQGVPRRTAFSDAPYTDIMAGLGAPSWLTAIGGVTMGVSGLLLTIVLIGTVLGLAGRDRETEIPVTDVAEHSEGRVWPLLDNWKLWIGVGVALILLAYIPFLAGYLPPNSTSTGAPFPLW